MDAQSQIFEDMQELIPALKDFMATLTNAEADMVILWLTANRIRQLDIESMEGLGIINSGFGVNAQDEAYICID